MERTVSAGHANQQFSKMLRAVQDGDSFVILSRGRPVARLTPALQRGSGEAIDRILAFSKSLPWRHAGAWRREDLYE
ncbi:MAG TPA: type II toxin-antitoxin system prevent-host-death family antitoxin [Caulobacteraceae bacterium]|nr:type II toxin-antitoxin system prevent-host-death family antitoxin [Caulobacteraceae bacterium]